MLGIGLLALGAIYLRGLNDLPRTGDYQGPYGDRINAGVVAERHTQDAVTAVNFDYRGFDTLGEEFILFVSVLGTVLLMRQADEKNQGVRPDHSIERKVSPVSEAVSTWTLGMTGPIVLFGFYLVTHGQLSPGGGFQGGVVLATAPLLIYLGKGFSRFKNIARIKYLEITESLGVLIFLLTGLAGIAWGKSFLQNILPLGITGDVFSSGSIFVINIATGLEVAAGFVLLLRAFLQETLVQDAKQ